MKKKKESTGVGCYFLLQGNVLTRGSNLGLPHGRQTFYPLSHQGSPNLNTASITSLIFNLS